MEKMFPITGAIRVLRANKVPFEPHLYSYEDKGGTKSSSLALGVDEHQIIKTLIMVTDKSAGLVILMHGDKEVSTKALARVLGVKSVAPASAELAQKLSGYQLGGTSPFGLKTSLPIFMEESIQKIPRIYINGGKRGFLVSMEAHYLVKILNPQLVAVAQEKNSGKS